MRDKLSAGCILCILLATFLFGFVVWRLSTPLPDIWLTAALYDRSRSMLEPCKALRGTIERALERSTGKPQSTVSVFATGDLTSALEPLMVFSAPLPSSQRLMKGKEKIQAGKEAYLSQIVQVCTESRTTEISPIFLDIKHVVAYLHSLAAPRVDLFAFVVSDLRETSDPDIVRALRKPLGTKSPLPEPIETKGVHVTICGYAQTLADVPPHGFATGHGTARRSIRETDRLIEVWSQLFSDPDSVKFEPFCPAPARLPQ